jgi:hypothetical protein
MLQARMRDMAERQLCRTIQSEAVSPQTAQKPPFRGAGNYLMVRVSEVVANGAASGRNTPREIASRERARDDRAFHIAFPLFEPKKPQELR